MSFRRNYESSCGFGRLQDDFGIYRMIILFRENYKGMTAPVLPPGFPTGAA